MFAATVVTSEINANKTSILISSSLVKLGVPITHFIRKKHTFKKIINPIKPIYLYLIILPFGRRYIHHYTLVLYTDNNLGKLAFPHNTHILPPYGLGASFLPNPANLPIFFLTTSLFFLQTNINPVFQPSILPNIKFGHLIRLIVYPYRTTVLNTV